MEFPPFLEHDGLGSERFGHSEMISAAYPHQGGSAHTLWWPCHNPVPETIILFIPGNPGTVDPFQGFLSLIHQQFVSSLSIFAHAYLGHSPGRLNEKPLIKPEDMTMSCQIKSVVEIYDSIRETYPHARVLVMAHSLGGWMTTQLLKERPDSQVGGVFFLFPVLCHVADTRGEWWVTRPGFWVFTLFLAFLFRLVPSGALRVALPELPSYQIDTFKAHVHSVPAITAALRLDREKINVILEKEEEVLLSNRDRIFVYYANDDVWVDHHKHHIIDVLGKSQVFEDVTDTHHAFTVRDAHLRTVATKCIQWLDELKI